MVLAGFVAPFPLRTSNWSGSVRARVSPVACSLVGRAIQRRRCRTWQASAAEEPKCEGGPLVEGPPLSPTVLAAEFITTFIFAHINVVNSSAALGAAASASTNGAVIASVCTAGMMLSGAHLNPAVSLALACTNRMPLSRAIFFIAIQLAAAVAATKSAALIGVNVASTFAGVDASASMLRNIWLECFPISVIVFVLFQTAVATKSEGGVGPQLAGLYIGFVVFAVASTFGPGIFNPALAFGRAFVLSSWASHWVYWTPVPAAMAAALLCEHIFAAPAGGRAPNSWLASLSKRLDSLTMRMKELGTGALIAYGICNIAYYVPVLCYTLLRGSGGVNITAAGLAKAWGITWAGSQVTKPARILISIAVAPFINVLLEARRRRRGAKPD